MFIFLAKFVLDIYKPSLFINFLFDKIFQREHSFLLHKCNIAINIFIFRCDSSLDKARVVCLISEF